MGVKLCPHFQTLPRWLNKKKNRVEFPGEWVKVMDPGKGISQRFPGKRIVGRWYLQHEEQFIGWGAQGAEDYYSLMQPHYDECRGEIAVFEAINEPGCQSLEQVERLGRFLLRWMELMHEAQFAVGVPAFSVGTPEPWVLGALDEIYALTDYATLHEYGRKAVNEAGCEFTSLRHRMMAGYMREHSIRVPPLLITECGIDRGGDGYRKKPGNTPWPAYLAELAWYEDELQQDEYVEAAFLFTSGATGTWRSFDVGEGEWRDLVKRLPG